MSETTQEVAARARSYAEVCGEYTSPYEREKLVADWAHKEHQAQGVLADFRKRVGDPAGAEMLEIGFGSGVHVATFAAAGARMRALEVNEVLLGLAQGLLRERGLIATLSVYDGVSVPYPDNSFDYIYSISVLEHASNPAKLLQEVARVLRPGGLCYIAFPNRWSLRETHTGFLFVGYLPRAAAKAALRFLGSNAINELNLHFLSFFSLQRMCRRAGLRIRMEREASTRPRRFLKTTLAAVGVHYSAILKTVMVVLEKPTSSL